MPLQHRRGYAADLHRGLPTGDITRSRSSRHDENAVPVRAATQPISARFELVALLRSVQPLVPHVRLSVSLAEPGPSGSADPPRRCRGLLPTLPGVSRIRLPPATTGPLRRPSGEGLPPPLGSRAPRGARSRRPRAGSARAAEVAGQPDRGLGGARVVDGGAVTCPVARLPALLAHDPLDGAAGDGVALAARPVQRLPDLPSAEHAVVRVVRSRRSTASTARRELLLGRGGGDARSRSTG